MNLLWSPSHYVKMASLWRLLFGVEVTPQQCFAVDRRAVELLLEEEAHSVHKGLSPVRKEPSGEGFVLFEEASLQLPPLVPFGEDDSPPKKDPIHPEGDAEATKVVQNHAYGYSRGGGKTLSVQRETALTLGIRPEVFDHAEKLGLHDNIEFLRSLQAAMDAGARYKEAGQ